MDEQLKALERAFEAEIAQAASLEALELLRVRFLGRKGELTGILRQMGSLSAEERPRIGALANQVKAAMEQALEARLAAVAGARIEQGLDVTLPGRPRPLGSVHVLNSVMAEIEDVFAGLGFELATGPEVEDDYHCFEALNIPAHHPARDMQDTFYFPGGTLLRTHTSPVQIRTMEASGVPVRIYAPGKVFRCDSDVTHSPMFHQVEGLWVDRGITFAHLRGVLYEFIQRLFGSQVPLRFRPSFFPFTEPSAEVDMGCIMCGGSGCRVCSGTGWLEILGCGMVDPAVFGYVNVDSEEYTGFAFGLGVERVAMLKYGISDIRLFFENDLRFLTQFA